MAIKLSDYICSNTTANVVQSTSDPTSSNDGHKLGTIWINTSTDDYFICTENASGAAVWSSGGADAVQSTSNPSSSDDSYDVGTIWVNTSTDKYYICTDNSSSSAVWESGGSTDEEIQDVVGDMVTGNTETNITVTYDDPNGKLDFAINTADNSTLGVASFNSTYFTVSSGAVSIANDSIGFNQLAHNINATSIGFNADQVDGVDVNDSGTTTSDLWTASKTKSYVDSLVSGLDWQDSVLDKDLSTPPASPSNGDRYIVGSSATDDWSGHDNDIAEYNGSSWDFTSVSEGMATWVEDEDVQYVYNGTSWAKLGTTLTHNNMLSLQGGTTNEYYHLTNTEHSAITGSKTANYVFASPDSSAGVGSFRALVANDIPSLTSSKISDFTEAAQDAAGAAITAGSFTNMTLTYDDSGNKIDGSVATATDSVLGVASFNNGDFTVTAGAVSINESGIDHGGLAGLADDDHTQYVHISTARTITAQHTFNPSSTSAPFVIGANASGQLVTGLNADMVDGHNWSVAATASAPASPSTNDVWIEIT